MYCFNSLTKEMRIIAGLTVALIGLSACSSFEAIPTRGDTSISPDDPTAGVVADIGAVNQTILRDVETYALVIGNSLDDYFSDAFNIEDPGKYLISTHTNVLYADDSSSGSNNDTFVEIEVTQTAENCDDGGTRQLVGTLDMQVSYLADEGELSGTYSILYDNCVELVLVTAVDGSCVISTQLSGTVTNAAVFSFSDLNNFDLDTFEIENDVSTGPFSFAIEDGGTDTIAFDYFLYVNSHYQNQPTSDGTLNFGSQNFDVVAVEDFVAGSAATAVCP